VAAKVAAAAVAAVAPVVEVVREAAAVAKEEAVPAAGAVNPADAKLSAK
jgi:hypothetical protein